MSVFNCNNCKRDYNDDKKKPLSLSCGHVFCQECIYTFEVNINRISVESSTNTLKEASNDQPTKIIKCPVDKKMMRVDINKIPVCLQIYTNLPLDKSNSFNNNLQCSRHPDKKIKYICHTHMVFPCSKCVMDHMAAGHELEAFEGNKESFLNEIKILRKNVENEFIIINEEKLKNENFERLTVDYYNNQFSKIEQSFEKLILMTQKWKKKLIEEMKFSFCDHKKKFDFHKTIINKNLEHVNKIKSIMSQAEENFEKRNYEEFFKIKNKIIFDMKNIKSNPNLTGEINYACFSNDNFDDQIEKKFGIIKYYKNINEIENSLKDSQEQLKSKIRLKRSNKSSYIFDANNNSNSNSNCTLGDKMDNIFQENLLNDNPKMFSPKGSNGIYANNASNSNSKFNTNNISNVNTGSATDNTNINYSVKQTSKFTNSKENIFKDSTNMKECMAHFFKPPKNINDTNLEGSMQSTKSKQVELNSDGFTTNMKKQLSNRETIVNNINNKIQKNDNGTNIISNQCIQVSNSHTNIIIKHNRNEKVILSQQDSKIISPKTPFGVNKNNINKNIILTTGNTINDTFSGERNNKNVNLNLNLNLNLENNNMTVSNSNNDKVNISSKKEVKQKNIFLEQKVGKNICLSSQNQIYIKKDKSNNLIIKKKVNEIKAGKGKSQDKLNNLSF